MNFGIHTIHQRFLIKFLRGELRVQVWSVLALGLILSVIAGAFVFYPAAPPELLAVALVQSPGASGSGFLVSDRLLLTTAKVTGEQGALSILFPRLSPVTGSVVFKDAERDVALVEIRDLPAELKPLPLGSSDALASGEEVELVGYPGDVYSVARATVVRKSADILETDATSSPGNSGGPLLRKTDGTVVGMASSTPELGGVANQGKHRVVPMQVIERACQEHNRPIR